MSEKGSGTPIGTLLPKISPSTIGCNPEIAKINGEPATLARLRGICKGTVLRVIPSQTKGGADQEFIGIVGSFEAVNLETGEVFQSGVLYLPGGIHEMIISVLQGMPEDEAAEVKFIVDLIAVPAKNPRGYSWQVRPVVEMALAHDPLDELREMEMKAKLRLPAPPKILPKGVKRVTEIEG